MINIDTGGIDAFNEALSLELLRLDQEISSVFQGWTQRIYIDAVEATPQFSSDAVRAWRYSVNILDVSYTESAEKYLYAQPHNLLTPHGMGDPEGVEEALQVMRDAPVPTWRDTVYISNNAPVAGVLQAGQIKLRPINMVTAGVIMIDYALTRATLQGTLI